MYYYIDIRNCGKYAVCKKKGPVRKISKKGPVRKLYTKQQVAIEINKVRNNGSLTPQKKRELISKLLKLI